MSSLPVIAAIGRRSGNGPPVAAALAGEGYLLGGHAIGHQLLRLFVDHARRPWPEPADRAVHLLGEFIRREWLDREQPEYREGRRAQLPAGHGWTVLRIGL